MPGVSIVSVVLPSWSPSTTLRPLQVEIEGQQDVPRYKLGACQGSSSSLSSLQPVGLLSQTSPSHFAPSLKRGVSFSLPLPPLLLPSLSSFPLYDCYRLGSGLPGISTADSDTLWPFLYSFSSSFCMSKSSCRSRLTRCCSISRTTPWCMAFRGGSSQRCQSRKRCKSYLFLEFLLEVDEDHGSDCEQRGAEQGELRSARHGWVPDKRKGMSVI